MKFKKQDRCLLAAYIAFAAPMAALVISYFFMLATNHIFGWDQCAFQLSNIEALNCLVDKTHSIGQMTFVVILIKLIEMGFRFIT